MAIGQEIEYDNSKQLGVFTDVPSGFISLTMDKEELLEQNPNLSNEDFSFAKGGVAKNGRAYLKTFVDKHFIGNYFLNNDVNIKGIKAAKAAGTLSFGISKIGRSATKEELSEMF